MVEEADKPLTKIEDELGVKPKTLQGWVNKYRNSPGSPFPGGGKTQAV